MASEKVIDKRFGELLRKQRDAKGWTQQEMAETVNKRVPMHFTTLAKIEKGDRAVRIAEAVAIADVLGVSLDRMLGRRAGVANEIADVVSQLQHTAGRAVTDIAGLIAHLQSLFVELGEVEFDGYQQLQESGGKALKALREAQDALYGVGQVEAPQRVVQSRIDELIEQRAEEKAVAMVVAKLKSLVAEDEGEA